jgi:hypothetical protein
MYFKTGLIGQPICFQIAGLVNQSSSTNHRQPIIVNQSTNHRQPINQSSSTNHRHTYLCHRPYFQHLFTLVVLVLHQDHAGFKHHQFRVQVFQPSGVPEKQSNRKKR